jgi:anti-sigma regulatory factor (Ser/Thr protein kinase)
MSKIRLQAKIENLERLMQFVLACAKRQGFTQKRIQAIELATEEALVNIFTYAYPEHTGEVEVRCKMDDDTRFILEILDTGIPFNIHSISEPDLTENISNRKIGGLGIFLMRKMVDEVQYRRDEENNILTLIIHKVV